MSEILPSVLAFLAGALLGVVFFVGLWWTVQKGMTSQWPALWFFGSLLLRTGLVLAGFYLVAQGHWLRFLVCLLGFFSARIIVVRRAASFRTPLSPWGRGVRGEGFWAGNSANPSPPTPLLQRERGDNAAKDTSNATQSR